MPGPYARVSATEAALTVIETLLRKHGPILFYQSGGCCEGSAPICVPINEMRLGSSDVKLGELGGIGFWMSEAQYEWWQHLHVILDAVPGRGQPFSLDGTEDVSFLSRPRLLSDEELADLVPLERGR